MQVAKPVRKWGRFSDHNNRDTITTADRENTSPQGGESNKEANPVNESMTTGGTTKQAKMQQQNANS